MWRKKRKATEGKKQEKRKETGKKVGNKEGRKKEKQKESGSAAGKSGEGYPLGPPHCSENPALLRKWGYKTSPSLALAGCFVIERRWWRRYLGRRLLGFRGG
jgi:hypothetical protein